MKAASPDVLEIERRIAARPEVVFSYFTDPHRYRMWQGVDAELDARPGGVFRVMMTGKTGVIARGVFLEVDEPKRLVFTWGWEQADGHQNMLLEGMREIPPGGSTVEIVLVADGDSTILRLRHRSLPSDVSSQVHTVGWVVSLDRLVALVQDGDAGPNVFADA